MSNIQIGVWDDDGASARTTQNITYEVRKWLFENGDAITWMFDNASLLNEDGTVTIRGKVHTPPERIVRMAPESLYLDESQRFGFESEVKVWRAREIAQHRSIIKTLSETL